MGWRVLGALAIARPERAFGVRGEIAFATKPSDRIRVSRDGVPMSIVGSSRWGDCGARGALDCRLGWIRRPTEWSSREGCMNVVVFVLIFGVFFLGLVLAIQGFVGRDPPE